MTNKEIFKKVIEKAVKNGWTEGQYHLKYGVRGISLSVIFSHDFAKAFWGEEEINTNLNLKNILKETFDGKIYQTIRHGFQYHLQQLVLCDNPIEYLAKFL